MRVTATAAVGMLVNVSSSGTAFAPAASAHAAADAAHAPEPAVEATVAVEALTPRIDLPPALPAELAAQPPLLRAASAPAMPAADVKASFDIDLRGSVSQGRPQSARGDDPDEVLQFGAMRVRRSIVETILRASAVADVDPVYMMALADKESSFATGVKASTSSAVGLFQFISSTWLTVVREHGAKHGLQAEAEAIEVVRGQLVVSDDVTREHILGLRSDPYISALMAAEMLKKDRAKIEQRIGRDLTRSEFYIAHFLGVDGAGRFMEILGDKPKQAAPKVFAAAARANRTLFFAKVGRKTRGLTVAEVYSKIDSMIDKRLGRYERVASLVDAAQLDASGLSHE